MHTLPPSPVTFGFTGTSSRVTPYQLRAIADFLLEHNVAILHHGDCINADKHAHTIARTMGLYIVVHPPLSDKTRAFCKGDEERKPFPYSTRNLHIAEEGVHGLLAVPKGFRESTRSGTWATVRYARKLKRLIWLILPNGDIVRDTTR